MSKEFTPTLRDLYPHLSEAELAEVEDTLERYLALVLRILERVETETETKGGQLTLPAREVK